MESKLLEEKINVINRVVDKVVDKKIENVMDQFLIKFESLDKRISNLEKQSQAIYQELNFYVAESKANSANSV